MLTPALVAGLIVRPGLTLHVLWDMVIPLLPAVLLVNPVIWRNVCPLATLNAVTGTSVGFRRLGTRAPEWSWNIGLVLLVLLVPARRFLFNENGPALAVVIVAVAALALVLGLLFTRRSGFCNAVCPVLPVEKLYGQAPLVSLGSTHCASCSLCTASGCLEIARGKAAVQTIGRARKDNAWLATPFGAWAAAFPGFVVGYFTAENGELSGAVATYGVVALCAAVSYALVAALVMSLRVRVTTAMLALGALSAGLYYWLVAPTLAQSYKLPVAGTAVVRVVSLALVAFWLWRALGVGRRPRWSPTV